MIPPLKYMQTGIPPRHLHCLHSSLLLLSLTWIIRVVSYWLSAATFDTLPPLHSIINTATVLSLLKGPVDVIPWLKSLSWLPSL